MQTNKSTLCQKLQCLQLISKELNYHNYQSSQYFKNVETGVCCLTYNTYEKIDKVRAALTDWSAKNGLAFEVYEPEHSWYYPNNTCFVVIHLLNNVIKLK